MSQLQPDYKTDSLIVEVDMYERKYIRYDTKLLPISLRNVTITWGVDASVESDVVNFSTHGLRVLISTLMSPVNIPKKNDTIKVKLPIVQVTLAGMCIYATNELDGSVSMGIYFYVPTEQNYLNKLLSKTLNVPLQECSFVCHEWEEFVDKLSNSIDPKLKNIGFANKEMLRLQ
jgi:hypothetical protein